MILVYLQIAVCDNLFSVCVIYQQALVHSIGQSKFSPPLSLSVLHGIWISIVVCMLLVSTVFNVACKIYLFIYFFDVFILTQLVVFVVIKWNKSKFSWKKRSSHQGKKEVVCIVSKPLISHLWGCGESKASFILQTKVRPRPIFQDFFAFVKSHPWNVGVVQELSPSVCIPHWMNWLSWRIACRSVISA